MSELSKEQAMTFDRDNARALIAEARNPRRHGDDPDHCPVCAGSCGGWAGDRAVDAEEMIDRLADALEAALNLQATAVPVEGDPSQEFMAKVERSSLGTPEAQALRATVSDEKAAELVRRSVEGDTDDWKELATIAKRVLDTEVMYDEHDWHRFADAVTAAGFSRSPLPVEGEYPHQSGDFTVSADDARAEAERINEWAEERFAADESAHGVDEDSFVAGAEWQASRPFTEEDVEVAAKAMDENFNPDRYPIMSAMFKDYARAALDAVTARHTKGDGA